MYGLSVRWDLTAAPEPQAVAEQLRDYVVGTSLEKFSGLPGLRVKTWRMRAGEWFEGTYVFNTAQARDAFAADFRGRAADSPVSQLVGAGPLLVQDFEVVAVAEGAAGFQAGPGPGSQDPALSRA